MIWFASVVEQQASTPKSISRFVLVIVIAMDSDFVSEYRSLADPGDVTSSKKVGSLFCESVGTTCH